MGDLILIIIVVSFFAFIFKKAKENEQKDKEFISNTIATTTPAGIKCDKIIVLNETVVNNEFPYVAFDNNSKNVAIKKRTIPIKYINYDDIVGIELVEDGTTSLSFGNIVGGSLIAGGAGAVIGGMNKKDAVSNLTIKFSLNDFNNPSYEIDMIKGVKIKKSDKRYMNSLKAANAVVDTVKYIINNKQKI